MDPDRSGRRAIAEAALGRATAFVRGETGRPWLATPPTPIRSRVLGNWLGELDRLLCVLIDDAAAGAAPNGRSHNAAAKLAGLAGDDADDQRGRRARLRGIGRARAAYRYTRGVATRPDVRGGAYLTAGWFGEGSCALARFALGEGIVMTGADLVTVCDLYDEVARLIASPEVERGPAQRSAIVAAGKA